MDLNKTQKYLVLGGVFLGAVYVIAFTFDAIGWVHANLSELRAGITTYLGYAAGTHAINSGLNTVRNGDSPINKKED